MIDNGSLVWLWDNDDDLMERTKVAIQIDYNRSTISKTAFWDATAPIILDNRLVYSATENVAKQLSGYDYYPPNPYLPVVSSELRSAIESACSPTEVAFHPCEVRTKGGKVLYAWNLYPLNQVTCIDREMSGITWKRTADDPQEWTINEASYINFRPSCLGGLNIARLKEDVLWIVVSDHLK